MTGCACGKVRYESKAQAKRTARAFRGPRRGKLRAYQCAGGFWHLTSLSAAQITYYRERAAAS
jgi:hypothetical protein